MCKLYFKKLLYTILFFVAYYIIVGCIGFVWALFFNSLFSEQFETIFIAILAIVILLIVLYKNRCNSAPHKRAYWEMMESGYITFRKDFMLTLKSKENMAHMLAFITLEFLFELPIGISAAATLWLLIRGLVIVLVTRGAAFILGNTLLWCLVHRRWQSVRKFAHYSNTSNR